MKLTSLHGHNALIAIQGPKSVEMMKGVTDCELGDLKYYFCTEGAVYGKRAVIARTGYTGEDGFELFLDGADASEVWQRLLREKEADGLEPAGLGARDVLRLEAGMPLYGHELTEEISPVAAGLQWAVKFAKPEFIGKEALEEQARGDRYPRIAGIVMDGKVPAREGYSVFLDGAVAGEIRSGSVAPSLGGKNIATALVGKEAAVPGTRLQVEVRGSRHGATVAEQPFYKRPK